MLCAMARAVSLGLPWLALMAISAIVAYGMNMVMTCGVATTTRADESVPIVIARPVGSEASVSGGWSVCRWTRWRSLDRQRGRVPNRLALGMLWKACYVAEPVV